MALNAMMAKICSTSIGHEPTTPSRRPSSHEIRRRLAELPLNKSLRGALQLSNDVYLSIDAADSPSSDAREIHCTHTRNTKPKKCPKALRASAQRQRTSSTSSARMLGLAFARQRKHYSIFSTFASGSNPVCPLRPTRSSCRCGARDVGGLKCNGSGWRPRRVRVGGC